MIGAVDWAQVCPLSLLIAPSPSPPLAQSAVSGTRSFPGEGQVCKETVCSSSQLGDSAYHTSPGVALATWPCKKLVGEGSILALLEGRNYCHVTKGKGVFASSLRE